MASGLNSPVSRSVASTLRFSRYRSSILYGCRAPVVSMRVIVRVWPEEVDTGMGESVVGPIASVSVRCRGA